MSRRGLMIANALKGGYVQDGLVCWVDGILNQTETQGTIKDQTGTYSIAKAGGSNASSSNNFIVVNGGAYNVPCGALTDTNSYTISITYRKRSNTNNGTHFMWSLLPFSTGQTPNGRANIGYVNGNTKLRYYQATNVNNFYYADNPSVTDYNAHCIDLVANGTSRKLYIDGVLTIDITMTSTYQNNIPITIGGYSISNACYIDMEMFSFRLYNRPITADEVLNNYNYDKSRFNI